MKWLKKKLRNWLQDDEGMLAVSTPEAISCHEGPKQSGMNFCLYKAVGGHVLESRQYNSKLDRNEGTLYMIHDDDDFAKQVAQAIMLEQMKQ